jgi:hypothetical protein
MSDLMDRLDAPDARKWEHEEGDVLVGTIVNLGTFTGDYGTSRTVTVDPEDGTTESGSALTEKESLIFYASASVAANELEAAGPKIGDRIGIKYHGTRPGKSGNDYKLYRIAVEHRDRLVDGLDSGDGW